MKRSLLFILFIFNISTISLAQLSLSFVTKGNYGIGKMQQNTFNTHPENSGELRFFPNADQIFSEIEIRVRPSFEMGVEGGFAINQRFNFIFGLNLQQVRVEYLPDLQFINIEPTPRNTLSYIYYLKIPLLLEFDLYKDKIFLQGGIYAASKIGYHFKELDRKASNPLVSENTTTTNLISEINSSDQFNSMLFGFQTGIKYQFWKKWSIDMSYSHSLNNLFNENTFIDMNLHNFSFGLQWRFM